MPQPSDICALGPACQNGVHCAKQIGGRPTGACQVERCIGGLNEPGMVLTLEPGVAIADKIMVHEENILITDAGPVYLSPKKDAELPCL